MSLRLKGSTSGYVELEAAATSSNNTLTLPNGNGTNGQVLQTDGSGGLSWQNSGGIPSGVIVMWSGSIASIPSGWALCDGTNSTPDLRNRFIVGAHSDAASGVTFNADTGAVSGDYAPGNTGGEVAHQLTQAEMPSHNHTLLASSATDGGSGSGWRWESNNSTRNSTVNGTNIGNTGGDDYHENRPPYYALAYIMKT